jgi:hypothetical protein
MDIDEVKDQTRNWLDARMKNPYFGAVIAVWLFEHRVIIYSIFNFEDGCTLNEKLAFIQNQLDNYTRWLIFEGLYGSIWFAFLFGLITMASLDVINGIGKATYKLVSKASNWISRQVDPLAWVPKEDYDSKEKRIQDLEEQISTRALHGRGLQKELDDAAGVLQLIRTEKDTVNSNLTQEKKLVATFQEELKIKNDERKAFKVNYAQYGTDDAHIEVTRIAANALATEGKFIVNNEVLKYDPRRFSPKKLFIEYEFNLQKSIINAKEGYLITLKDGELLMQETEESQNLEIWNRNLERVTDLFRGSWTLVTKIGSERRKENIKIDELGKYFVEGQYKYDLLIPEMNETTLRLFKIDLDSRQHAAREELQIQNPTFITGTDDRGNEVNYNRLKP